MHKTSHMPAGWMPAYAHFAQFSDEQLLEQSLPTEQSRRKNILRCIYTNGTRFVYYKGDFDDEKLRSARLYNSWKEAFRLGDKKFQRFKSKQKARLKNGGSFNGDSQDVGVENFTTASAGWEGVVKIPRISSTTLPASCAGPSDPFSMSAKTPTCWRPASQCHKVPTMPAADGAVSQHPLPAWAVHTSDNCRKASSAAAMTGMPCAPDEWCLLPPRPPPPPPPPPLPQQVTVQVLAASPYADCAQPTSTVACTIPPQATANKPGSTASGRPEGVSWHPANSTTPLTIQKSLCQAFSLSAPTQAMQQQQQLMHCADWYCQHLQPATEVPAGYTVSQEQPNTNQYTASAFIPAPAVIRTPVSQVSGFAGVLASGDVLQPGLSVMSIGTQSKEGERYSNPHQQQRMVGCLAHGHAGSSTKANPHHSYSTDIQKAPDSGALLPQSVMCPARVDINQTSGPRSVAVDLASNPAALQAAAVAPRPGELSAADVTEVGCKWNLSLQLCRPKTRSATGQQLLISTGTDIGSGGGGEVSEVEVKLYGPDSLAAVRNKNEALSRLLQRTACSCGAAPPEVQQGPDGDTPQGSSDGCCCSVRMALKVPKSYANLPHAMQTAYTAGAYQEKADEATYTEYCLMDKCHKSNHIIDCYALGLWQQDEDVQQLCLLLELSELGSVEQHYSLNFQASKGLDDLKTQRLVRQVAAGLADMHRMARTLHRDIKWSNLLLFGSLEAPTVKICDFGISRELVGVGEYGSTLCGTLEWMPPEQADRGVGQDWRVDSFPLGLLVLALRTGLRPFWWISFVGLSIAERARMLATALDEASCPYNHSNGIYSALGPVEKAFVRSCLTADISRRPSPEALIWIDRYLLHTYSGG